MPIQNGFPVKDTAKGISRHGQAYRVFSFTLDSLEKSQLQPGGAEEATALRCKSHWDHPWSYLDDSQGASCRGGKGRGWDAWPCAGRLLRTTSLSGSEAQRHSGKQANLPISKLITIKGGPSGPLISTNIEGWEAWMQNICPRTIVWHLGGTK